MHTVGPQHPLHSQIPSHRLKTLRGKPRESQRILWAVTSWPGQADCRSGSISSPCLCTDFKLVPARGRVYPLMVWVWTGRSSDLFQAVVWASGDCMSSKPWSKWVWLFSLLLGPCIPHEQKPRSCTTHTEKTCTGELRIPGQEPANPQKQYHLINPDWPQRHEKVQVSRNQKSCPAELSLNSRLAELGPRKLWLFQTLKFWSG